ncbi:MAG: ATP-binding protein [bacterium]
MKILVIEDEIKIASIIKLNLEFFGNEVMLAHDGKNGLLAAKKNFFDIILIDIMLPGLDGFAVTKSIRRESNTPIIVLTARDAHSDRMLAFNAGASAYMIKPINFKTLILKIEELTKKNQNKVIQDDKIKKEKNIKNDNINAKQSIEVATLNKSIMDNAPISIITINKDGYITSANKYFKQVSKTKRFHNHNVFQSEFFIREKLVDDYRELLQNGKAIKRERCYEKNNKGEEKYLKIIASPLLDNDGNISGALSMALDNTEEVVSKNNLVALNNDLKLKIKQGTEKLRVVNKKLARALKIKSSFAADVSHEMRTSLTIIQGNVELIDRQYQTSNKDKESSKQIFQEIERISNMLTSLTSIANSESPSQKLTYEKVNLNELIRNVCKSIQVLCHKKNIKLTYRNTSENTTVAADKARLEELCLNLIRNAIKYNKNNGSIKIQTHKQGDMVCIKIKDSGIGIQKKHLPFIFERFYKIDSARTRNTDGSGLGLSICKWIAETHGGKISVTSKLNIGTTFIVNIPILKQKNNQTNKKLTNPRSY